MFSYLIFWGFGGATFTGLNGDIGGSMTKGQSVPIAQTCCPCRHSKPHIPTIALDSAPQRESRCGTGSRSMVWFAALKPGWFAAQQKPNWAKSIRGPLRGSPRVFWWFEILLACKSEVLPKSTRKPEPPQQAISLSLFNWLLNIVSQGIKTAQQNSMSHNFITWTCLCIKKTDIEL